MVDAPFPAPHEEEARRQHPTLGYALVVGAVALWSLNAVVAKVVIESGGLSAMRLAEVRSTGSGLLMLAALALMRPRTLRFRRRREWLWIAAFGIGGLAFVHFLYFAAIQRLDIGTGLVIEYIAPALVAAWARFFVHEPVRRRLWIALAVALGGLALVVELPNGVTLNGLGVAAAFAGAFAYAFYILMADRSLKEGRDAPSLLAWGLLFAGVFWAIVQPRWSFPGGLVAGDASLLGRLAGVSAPVWLLLLSVVVLGTIVPFVMILNALHHLSPTRVVVVAMLEPVLATLTAFAWLEESHRRADRGRDPRARRSRASPDRAGERRALEAVRSPVDSWISCDRGRLPVCQCYSPFSPSERRSPSSGRGPRTRPRRPSSTS